ncbi:MAG: hypothetical protein GYA21_02725 [Myxococcales bacterium]|nr:hypothetical protein [Myxococcales bacterium]
MDGSAVPTDIEPDLLVLYEEALARDNEGQKKPKEALAAWKAVATFGKGKNPFRTDAARRVKEWEKYAASRAALWETSGNFGACPQCKYLILLINN